MKDSKESSNQKRLTNLGIIGACITTILASLCCIVPLLFVTIGISGAWISSFRVFEPYKPVFLLFTCLFLGLAMFVHYNSQNTSCADGTCSTKKRKTSGILLWCITITISAVLIFPYAVVAVSEKSIQQEMQTKQVTLEIEGMTCSACPITVRKSLINLKGVKKAIVTLEPPEAVVIYEPKKVSLKELIEATTNAGYPTKVKNEKSKEKKNDK